MYHTKHTHSQRHIKLFWHRSTRQPTPDLGEAYIFVHFWRWGASCCYTHTHTHTHTHLVLRLHAQMLCNPTNGPEIHRAWLLRGRQHPVRTGGNAGGSRRKNQNKVVVPIRSSRSSQPKRHNQTCIRPSLASHPTRTKAKASMSSSSSSIKAGMSSSSSSTVNAQSNKWEGQTH